MKGLTIRNTYVKNESSIIHHSNVMGNINIFADIQINKEHIQINVQDKNYLPQIHQYEVIVEPHGRRHYILICFWNLPVEAALFDWFSVLFSHTCKITADLLYFHYQIGTVLTLYLYRILIAK